MWPVGFSLFRASFLVSIPKRVSEVLWPADVPKVRVASVVEVSIPKRVSEVLWPPAYAFSAVDERVFQSLKGFQRFCGS